MSTYMRSYSHLLRSFSSVGLEHGSYESGVTGSSPVRSIFTFISIYKIKILILYIICLILVLVVPSVAAAAVLRVAPQQPAAAANLSDTLALALAAAAIFKAVDEVRPFLSQINLVAYYFMCLEVIHRCDDTF